MTSPFSRDLLMLELLKQLTRSLTPCCSAIFSKITRQQQLLYIKYVYNDRSCQYKSDNITIYEWKPSLQQPAKKVQENISILSHSVCFTKLLFFFPRYSPGWLSLSLFLSVSTLYSGTVFLLLLNRKTFSVYLIASPAVFQFLFDLDPTRPTRLLCWIGDLLTTIDQNRQTWMRLCRQHRTQLSFLLLLY